jgi:hypothetical protein
MVLTRVLLVLALLLGLILIVISLRQDALTVMSSGSVYMFLGGAGIILTVLVISVVFVIMSE